MPPPHSRWSLVGCIMLPYSICTILADRWVGSPALGRGVPGVVGAAWCLCRGDVRGLCPIFCLKLGDKRSLGLDPQPCPRCTHKEINDSPLPAHPLDSLGIPTFLLMRPPLAISKRADGGDPSSSPQVSSRESQ